MDEERDLVPAEEAESTVEQSEPTSFDEIAAQALDNEEQGEELAEEPQEQSASSEEQAAALEEHLKWVSSVEGNTDPETGELIPDRVARQAYELNKQNQEQARNLQQLNEVFANPIVKAAVEKAFLGGQQQTTPAEPATPPAPTKSLEEMDNQELLEHYVSEAIQTSPVVTELKTQVQNYEKILKVLEDNHVESTLSRTLDHLHQKFGEKEYQEVAPQVKTLIEGTAREVNMDVPTLIRQLAIAGKLEAVLENATMTALYPKVSAKVQEVAKVDEAKKETLQRAKAAKGLPRRGNSVTPVQEVIDDFEAAALAAEKELAASA